MSPNYLRGLLFLLFTASGFAGLIYESIWSHYLKLFLGHAAYAQTLVLAIFMGGMAVGSWICSRRSGRWQNLLLGYAIAEGLIGLCAIVFDAMFRGATGFAYDHVFPLLPGSGAVAAFKWSLATALILPQSVLLGMTFPLMTAGFLRLFPHAPGGSIAMLYFTNSLGAAVGVLASGFWLIGRVGLPGTIMTAGLINIGLALVVWLIARRAVTGNPPGSAAGGRRRAGEGATLLLAVSLLTGASSFMYEIGWIRMLSLVLGSSTHAFELMLSAFILGLALGGLWVRMRIDRYADGRTVLGWVQVAMGLLALASLVAYGGSFDAMRWALQALGRTEPGYAAFNLASHGIAMAVMLPTTFCAGMTLPLITHQLLRAGAGEGAIGAVYAFNTVGAIVGVVLAVHLLMPGLGLKGLIVLGASIDLALGLVLILGGRTAGRTARRPALATAFGLAGLAATLLWVRLDPYLMASGVYRHGDFIPRQENRIAFHRDGKTATVDVVASDAVTGIRTNGKSDAAIRNRTDVPPSPDESTMILAAALPLAMNPAARTAANIGFGSGLTTHSLLGSPALARVDTIEIEPAMVEGAKLFRPRVERAFSDPRGNLVIDDAKSYFSSRGERYDIIVSEPSNPWVSGVASLFTDEFYGLAVRHLAPDGLFVQWLQLYETRLPLVVSVLKAISANFGDFRVYTSNSVDLLIVATPAPRLPSLQPDILRMDGLYRELARVGVRDMDDLQMHHVAGRDLLAALVSAYPVPVNSDYFPFLDQNAAKARFMQADAMEILDLGAHGVPAVEMLENLPPASPKPEANPNAVLRRVGYSAIALRLREAILGERPLADIALGFEGRKEMDLALRYMRDCADAADRELWLFALHTVAERTTTYLPAPLATEIWRRYRSSPCHEALSPWQRRWVDLFEAVAARDPRLMAAGSRDLLAEPRESRQYFPEDYLLAVGLTGHLAEGDREGARRLLKEHGSVQSGSPVTALLIRLLAALAQTDRSAGGLGRR